MRNATTKLTRDLRKMLGRAGRDRYLQAILNQALAQVEWSRGNYDPALKYFETAVEIDALPDEAHFALMYQIAQLYFMKDRYDDALDRLDLWFCTVPPEKVTSAAYVLKASIHARQEDYPAVARSHRRRHRHGRRPEGTLVPAETGRPLRTGAVSAGRARRSSC